MLSIAAQPKAPPAPAPNTPLGPFILVDRIAVGGMAEVFRALEPRSAGEPRVVVLKRMLPEMAHDLDAVRLFQQEAELGLQIDHPNVVHVLNAGELQGHHYLTLEYVPGCDLWRLLRMMAQRGQQLPLELNMHIARSLLAGLSAIHNARSSQGEELSVVHNDVSPSNVLISVHGEVKLTDLGIAHAQTHIDGDQAQTKAQKKGKLGYMSPEQITGEQCDHRADIFAAGVLIAELLMHRPLFSAGSELAILLAIRDGDIHPFLEVANKLPKNLADAILRALATRRDNRWSSAQEFSDALAPWDTLEKIGARNELARIVTEIRLQLDSGTEVRSSLPGIQDSENSLPPTSSLLDHNMPTTADVEPLEYHVRKPDGTTLGPFTYATLVEKISVGLIEAGDEISMGKSSFRPVASFTDLVRHMSITQQAASTGRIAQLVSKSSAACDHGGFVRVLVDSVLSERTGLWLCEFGGVRKEVYLQRGVPTFVTSNLASELLGEYLVSKKIIGREELDMALAVMPRFEGKLGDTLIELGLVEPVQLFRVIGEQIQDKLVDLFTWERGSAAFYENINPPLSEFPLNLDAWTLLEAGMATRIRNGLENELMFQREQCLLELEPAAIARCNLSKLPASVNAVIDACTKPITLDQLVSKLEQRDPSDPQKPYRIVALLLYGQVLHWLD